jgi:predicted amidohydrolase
VPVIALVQYQPEPLADWQQARHKLDAIVGHAVAGGAQLVVFPEYAAMELTALQPDHVRSDLVVSLASLQGVLPDFLAMHDEVARRYGAVVVAGGFPVRAGDVYRNRAHVFSAGGLAGFQDKLVPTRVEREQWGVSGGGRINVFVAPWGRFAVAICHDIQVSPVAAAMAEASVDLILCPFRTDSGAGFHRVRTCARARAVEHQIFVAQAPLAGKADWSPAIAASTGRAALFTPCDDGFPADGVLAEAAGEMAQVVVAPLDFAQLARVREQGQALKLPGLPPLGIETVTLA